MRPLHAFRAFALALAMVTCAATQGLAGPGPALPDQVPPATRAKLAPVTDKASLAAVADGEPFRARRDVFEYLLDHPEFATHLTRTLRLARYRVWTVPGGYGLDDGWGTVGTFETVYAAPGIRVMHVQGEYQQRLLPNIHGQVIISISYAVTPATDGMSTIAASVGSIVKLDSRLLALAGRLASSTAKAKAEKEGARLVKTFARATRAIHNDPAGVYEALRQRPDTPRPQLEEFRRLLSLPPGPPPAAAARR